MDLLTACKMAYRKHHLDDDSIGWDELGDVLLDALCDAMGDDGFHAWLASNKQHPPDAKEQCQFCDRAFEYAYNYCPYCGRNMRR